METFPAVIGLKAGQTLDRSSVHHRANTEGQTTIHADTQQTINLTRASLWTARVPGDNPHKHRETGLTGPEDTFFL